MSGDPHCHGSRAFGKRTHGQQHPPHIRVYDNGICGFVFMHGAADRPALQPLTGIINGRLVCDFSKPQALHPNAQSSIVHHREHCLHALMGFADEPAFGIIKVHHTSCGGLDAHFIFD